MDKTKVELTEEDARLFLLFQEYYENFKVLVDDGFFEITEAAGTVHFDPDGRIRRVDVPHVHKH